jgi:hypothetical protein
MDILCVTVTWVISLGNAYRFNATTDGFAFAGEVISAAVAGRSCQHWASVRELLQTPTTATNLEVGAIAESAARWQR